MRGRRGRGVRRLFAHFLSLGMLGNVLVAASGLVLMLPTRAQPQPDMLDQVWALVNATSGIRWRFCHAFQQELSLQH